MKILKTANLGRSVGGRASDIRYQLFDTLGNSQGAASGTGVYEVVSNSGMYGVQLDINTQFSGSIAWTLQGSNTVFAMEELSADQKMARYIHTGRWKIDKDTKKMIFFQDDNVTQIASFNLFDRDGNPSIDEIFERVLDNS